MISLIASDLDDTIINRKNFICEENYKAFSLLENKNIPLAICTGKTYCLSKKICEETKASYGIFGNGTHIVNLKTKENIYSKLITKEQILSCIKIAQKYNLHIHAYSKDGIITEKLLYLDLRNYKMFESGVLDKNIEFKIVPNIAQFFETNDLDIYKFVISGTQYLTSVKEEILKENQLYINIINKTGQYMDSLISKEYSYLDIIPFGLNKGTSLAYLCEYLKIPLNNVIAIGDNLNDLEFLQIAGTGVALNNSYPDLKEVADYITVKNVTEGGFAEAVFKYI